MANVTKEQVVEFLGNLTLLDAAALVKELETTFGVSASAPMAVAHVVGDAGGAAKEEQTEFTVVLEVAGDKKINVIKEVRAITGLGLKEAKDLVEGAPKNLKEGISKDDANKIKAALEKEGATIKIK